MYCKCPRTRKTKIEPNSVRAGCPRMPRRVPQCPTETRWRKTKPNRAISSIPGNTSGRSAYLTTGVGKINESAKSNPIQCPEMSRNVLECREMSHRIEFMQNEPTDEPERSRAD